MCIKEKVGLSQNKRFRSKQAEFFNFHWKKHIRFARKSSRMTQSATQKQTEPMFPTPQKMPERPEMVILVDENDREIGLCEKLVAHQQALRHRAFSVFIFRKTQKGLELLLQQRAHHKYHSGGLWTNSCCSHPRQGETTAAAAVRRLQEELGFTTALTYAGALSYRVPLNESLIEHEYDHVFYGFVENDVAIHYNPQEITAIAWQEVAALQDDMTQHPQKYTAWFAQALEVALHPRNGAVRPTDYSQGI
jgi:isopentenyl-diphosphate delta-isomerase